MNKAASRLIPIPWPWLCYISVLLLLSSGQLIRKLLSDTGGPPSRYGALFAVALILLYVSAWCNGRALGKQWLWKPLLVLMEILVIAGLGFSIYLLSSEAYLSSALLGAGSLLLLPALYALFQYVYRSPDIWDRYGNGGGD